MLDNLITAIFVFFLSLVPSSSVPAISIPNNEVSILFTGDIMLGRSVMGASLDNNDPYFPFRKTSEFLKNADLTFVNLENPITRDCQRHSGGFTFCTTPEIAKGLSFSGIDIVTLANNHSANYGKEGIEETKKYLTDDGVSFVGQNNLVIKEVKGTKYGFLGFDYVTSQINLESNLELIRESDPKVDILIVGIHWGEEYKDTANIFQTSTAKRIVESGADLIIGHHPHWVQNFEEVNGVPVYYSLGNFVFDQAWSEETKKGLVVKITFDGKEIIKKEEFKTYTPIKGQPEILESN